LLQLIVWSVVVHEIVGMPERSEQSGPSHMKPRLNVRSWHTDMVPFAVVIVAPGLQKGGKAE
jgi:hypothetical protein